MTDYYTPTGPGRAGTPKPHAEPITRRVRLTAACSIRHRHVLAGTEAARLFANGWAEDLGEATDGMVPGQPPNVPPPGLGPEAA